MKPLQWWILGISLVLLMGTFAWMSTHSISCRWDPFGGGGGAATRVDPIDVNTARFDELDAVPYLTPQVAEGILEGAPWESIDQLIEVRGIGEATLEKIRPYLYVE